MNLWDARSMCNFLHLAVQESINHIDIINLVPLSVCQIWYCKRISQPTHLQCHNSIESRPTSSAAHMSRSNVTIDGIIIIHTGMQQQGNSNTKSNSSSNNFHSHQCGGRKPNKLQYCRTRRLCGHPITQCCTLVDGYKNKAITSTHKDSGIRNIRSTWSVESEVWCTDKNVSVYKITFYISYDSTSQSVYKICICSEDDGGDSNHHLRQTNRHKTNNQIPLYNGPIIPFQTRNY